MENSTKSWDDKSTFLFLQLGTMLEYFDLMLFVHMAVVLNNHFFPQNDPNITAVLSAIAFCSTYVFRPFGAWFFGYIGDKYGRKPTVTITMLMMGIPCGILTLLPTYNDWGIWATIIVTLCRIVQGMSSLGEIIGAELYLIETLKKPQQYYAIVTLAISSAFGSLFALILTSFAAMSSGNNWRLAFGFAFGIALAGSAARTRLRETPEFSNMRLRLKNALEQGDQKETSSIHKQLSNETAHTQGQNHKTLLMYLLLQCMWPVCFYFAYMYCGDLLKILCGYTSAQMVVQNLLVAVAQIIGLFFVAVTLRFVHPLTIVQVKLAIFALCVVLCPFILESIYASSDPLENAYNGQKIFLIQCLFLIFAPSSGQLLSPLVYAHFPILKRFTYASVPYAFSRALMYPIASFGLIYAIKGFGNYVGLWLIFAPVTIAFGVGLAYFIKLEKLTLHYRDFSFLEPFSKNKILSK